MIFPYRFQAFRPPSFSYWSYYEADRQKMQGNFRLFVKFFRALKTNLPAINLPKTCRKPAEMGLAEFIKLLVLKLYS
jgi:hypothetical protein